MTAAFIIYFRAIGFYSDMFAELDAMEREIERIQIRTNMISIIQNHKYCPSVKSGRSIVMITRKTPFANKRIGCKRKRRAQF